MKVSQESKSLASADMLVVDRLEEQLRKALPQWQKKPRTKLPQERVLAKQFGVSRRSLRDALGRLRSDNLIQSVPGRGTFIIPQKTSREILLICRETFHAYDVMSLRVLTRLLQRHGYRGNMVIAEDAVSEMKAVLADRPAPAGGILIGPLQREKVQSMVDHIRFPFVHIGDLNETVRGPAICDNVLNDNVAMAYRAVEQLVSEGHRRIAFLTWNRDNVWLEELERGYRQALQVADIDCDPNWIVRLPASTHDWAQDRKLYFSEIGSVQSQIDHWNDSANAPTAIIHSAANEAWIRDLLHYKFNDQFADDAVVAITYYEYLDTNYMAFRPARAICSRLEDVATRALEILTRQRQGEERPIREVIERTCFCERHEGRWSIID
jgi:DNA-binding LacI/PurR family transcriptional regulator